MFGGHNNLYWVSHNSHIHVHLLPFQAIISTNSIIVTYMYIHNNYADYEWPIQVTFCGCTMLLRVYNPISIIYAWNSIIVHWNIAVCNSILSNNSHFISYEEIWHCVSILEGKLVFMLPNICNSKGI